jgi:hypothetical protein
MAEDLPKDNRPSSKSKGFDSSIPYTIPSNKPMENPFGILRKIPNKIVKAVLSLFQLDRILYDIFLATISVPDERLRSFLEKRLVELSSKIEGPLKDISEKLADSVLRPIVAAIPFVGTFKAIEDLVIESGEAVEEAKINSANVIKDVVREAKDLYQDIAAPSRGLSSLLLGLSNYLAKANRRGEIGVDGDEILDEVGGGAEGMGGIESGVGNKRVGADLMATAFIKEFMDKYNESVSNGTPMTDKEMMELFTKKIQGIIEKKEARDIQPYLTADQRGLIDVLMGIEGSTSPSEEINTNTNTNQIGTGNRRPPEIKRNKKMSIRHKKVGKNKTMKQSSNKK